MKRPPPKRWLFGTPEQRAEASQYWIRDTAVGLWNTGMHEALRLLPTDVCSGFGATTSRLSPLRYRQSDARARRLMQRIRREAADPAWVDDAMRRLWRNIGRTMAEYSVLDRLWPEGRIDVQGLENIDAVTAAGRPAVLAGLHLGNWEVLPLVGAAVGISGAGFYLVPDNRFEHRIAVRVRKRIGRDLSIVPGVATSLGTAAAELADRRGRFLIYVDEFARGRVGAPLFGRSFAPKSNLIYAVRLAMQTGAEILPCYCLRIGDASRFMAHCLPPIPLADSGNDKTDVMVNIERLNAVIEPIVTANVDQWYYALDVEFES